MAKPTRCVIYVRISLDRTGEGAGVERQEAECRLLAAALGMEVIAVYVDNDVSAASGKTRPEFERLLADRPQCVIVFAIDRLVRKSKELERIIDAGFPVHSVTSGHVDLSNPAGRAVAKTVVAWAQFEGEMKGDRQRAANRQRKAQGRVYWTTRPFGYNNRGKTHASEAAALREIYRRCAAGDLNLARHARSLNEQGFATTQRARPLASSTLRSILLSERNVGGAGIEPLIDEDTWMTVRDALQARGRAGGQSPVGLLCGVEGVLRCGVCGGHMMTGNAPAHTRSHRKTYQCATGSHMVWPKEELDDIVSIAAAAMIRRRRIAIEAVERTGTDDASEALQRLALDFAAGRLTTEEFTDAATRERERLDRRGARPLVFMDWDDLTHQHRRAALAELIEKIELPSRGRGRGSVDLDVVLDAITWR